MFRWSVNFRKIKFPNKNCVVYTGTLNPALNKPYYFYIYLYGFKDENLLFNQ